MPQTAGSLPPSTAGGYDAAFVHHCRFRQSPGLLRFLKTPAIYFLAEPPRSIYDPPLLRSVQRRSTLRRALDAVDPLPLLYRRELREADLRNTRAATAVLANSAFSRETILRIYHTSCAVCYLGVDMELFRPLQAPRRAQVLSVGMLNPCKGFDFVIRSLALVPAQQRPPLIIVANSEQPGERAYLEDLALKLGVDMTIRLMVSDEELVGLYNQSLAMLYAPILEPFGLTPIEAMACGTPVIGVREGGVRETVVDGMTGALVEREPEAMAAALCDWLDNPQRAIRLGEQAQEYARTTWTWERTVDILEKHLARVAGRRGAA